MSFTLPPLSYDYIALEPYIDMQTMHLHHTKHHQTYINKVNAALKAGGETEADLVSIQRGAKSASAVIRNNGGGHYNHSLFWKWMCPVGQSNTAPFGALKSKIEQHFDSVDNMKAKFGQAAVDQFGSGWAWLSVSMADGSLKISSTPNQDNPLMEGDLIPILGLDVWEHAYYLKYNNRRPEYVEKWWNVVNWDAVVKGYDQFASKGKAVPIDL